MVATTRGRAYALEQLAERRRRNETRQRIDNAAPYAGAPMHFDCIGCGDDIVVSELYVDRPKLCIECRALHDLGWME